jgi:hypothetical protein
MNNKEFIVGLHEIKQTFVTDPFFSVRRMVTLSMHALGLRCLAALMIALCLAALAHGQSPAPSTASTALAAGAPRHRQ